MRELFKIESVEIDENSRLYTRPSVRSIIIRDGKIALLHSKKFNFYKFPGGGIEKDENPEDTIIRETREEAGLIVKKGSIREFGKVKIYERLYGEEYNVFDQDNLMYLCEVEDIKLEPIFEGYEKEQQLVVEFIEPQKVIDINNNKIIVTGEIEDGLNEIQKLTNGVLSILIEEGYFDN